MNRVAVSIVAFNSGKHLPRCLDAILSQTYAPVDVYVVDNASSDDTVPFVSKNYPSVTVIRSETNLGYGGGHNLVIHRTDSPYVLALNPDAYLSPTFLEELVAAIETRSDVGIAGGKLYSLRNSKPDGESEPIIDMTWLDIEKKRRQVCYAQFERDRGQNSSPRFVFGIDGAATLLRRSMLEEIRIGHEYYDEDFFAGKEDLDISWRAQLYGWRCLYVPSAVGHHVRTFTSKDRRSDISESLRVSSVRNRYLLMTKNDLPMHLLRHLAHIALYEIKIMAYVLLREPSSVKGYAQALKLFPKAVKKRRIIMDRKRVADAYILQWFR